MGLSPMAHRPKESMSLEERIQTARRENPGTRIDCYVLFSSHTDAMELYGLVRGNGLGARISTTPRQARSSCGVALLIDCDDALAIEGIANDSGVPVENIVPLVNQINPNRDIYC